MQKWELKKKLKKISFLNSLFVCLRQQPLCVALTNLELSMYKMQFYYFTYWVKQVS